MYWMLLERLLNLSPDASLKVPLEFDSLMLSKLSRSDLSCAAHNTPIFNTENELPYNKARNYLYSSQSEHGNDRKCLT